MGKITVIKNYALLKLVYVLSSLPDSIKTTIKQIETIMFDFIWDSKIVSEYDQEIPQSQTADNPVAP